MSKMMLFFMITIGINSFTGKVFADNTGKNLLYNSSFELGTKGYQCATRLTCVSGASIDYKGVAMSSDASTAYVGKSSIKINVYPKANLYFSSHEMKLDYGKKYTFSFFAKSNGEKVATSIYFGSLRNGWRVEKRKSFAIKSSEWKRYSYTFTVKHKSVFEYEKYYFMIMNIYPGTKEKNIWLDGIQLQEGKIGNYAPVNSVESAIYSPNIFVGHQELSGTLKTISYRKSISNYKMTLRLEDCFFNETIEKQQIKLNLPQEEVISKKVHFNSKRLGSLQISCGGPMASCSAAYFAHVLKPSGKTFGNGFQPGMQAGALESFRFKSDKQAVHWYDTYGKPGTFAKQVKLSGATWVNSFSTFAPFYIGLIKPSEKRYDWSFADLYIKNAIENKLAPVILVPAQSLLTNKRGRKPGKLMPAWLKKSDRFGKPEGSCLGTWSGMYIVLPAAEVIADFFRVLVGRYGKKVIAYQIFPECNGYMSAKQFVEIMKHVYKEIKKVNSDAKVIGLTPTGDYSSNYSKFFEECLSLGASNYTDIYAYHPYKSRMDNSPVSAMDGNRIMQKLNKKKGGNKELWITELYYLLPVPPENRNEDTYGADAVARRLLIDMGEGVTACTLMSNEFFFNNPLAPHQSFSSIFGGLVPSARFAAFSAVARFTTGARPVKTLELNKGSVLCYLFRNNDKLFSTIWSVGEKQLLDISFPEKLTAIIYDMFGNKVKEAKGQLKLKIDRNPLYRILRGLI